MDWNDHSLARAARLINEITRSHLSLDLSGLNVVTEAATGAFAVTAAIAALAGAEVQAIAADSQYGSFDDARIATLSVAAACGVEPRVHVLPR